MQFLDVDGRRIEYRMILGDALKGPTLVFLHEGLGCASLWRDFPDKVAKRLGLPALVYSRFGYGHSAPISTPRTPRFMHEEALDVLPRILDALAITDALLIGHSDGASIALIYAASPESRCRGLVLIAPHVLVEDITLRSIAHVAEAYETKGLRDRLARYHGDVDGAFLGWSRIWLDPRFRTWSLAAETELLAVPTLLIQGDKDEYGTLVQLDAIADLAKVRPQRFVVESAGHSPHRDAESAVLESTVAFAEGLQGAKNSSLRN